MKSGCSIIVGASLGLVLAAPAVAQEAREEQAAELAKKLANPVASLISVPLQHNYDEFGGANDGAATNKLVIQPVIWKGEEWSVPLIVQAG